MEEECSGNERGRVEKLEIYFKVWRKFRCVGWSCTMGPRLCESVVGCEQYERGCSYDKSIHLFSCSYDFSFDTVFGIMQGIYS